MLLSMTGFGEAHRQLDGLAVAVEVRTINSRFFKLTVRAGEGYGSLESRIEEVVRKSVHRGTIQVNLRVDRLRPEQYKINVEVLDRYRGQIQSLYRQWDLSGPVPIDSLLLLPGVVDDQSACGADADEDWPAVCGTLEAAMKNLAQMRVEEGRAMAADLSANCRAIGAGLAEIERRAPLVIDAYRNRLEERLKRVLSEYQVALDPADVVKEVSLFADRGDISEEIVRLRSHLEQFDSIMALPESSGRNSSS